MNTDIKLICLSPGTLGSGGIGRNTLNLAHAFLKKNIQVDLVFTGTTHNGRDGEIPKKANIFQLGKRTRYALPETVKYLRRRKPDILISAHNHVNALNIAAHRISGIRKKCRLVCTFRTYRSSQLKSSDLQNRLYDFLALKLYKYADNLVAVSKGVARDVEESMGLPENSVKTIYNPAWSEVMEKKAQEECNEQWLKNKKYQVIISVGRLTKEKDFPALLRGFAQLRKKKSARLIILGEGEERNKLEGMLDELGISDVVKMPGHVSNPLSYMAKSDLFVLSSRWEGFGNVLVEALGCGLPIVSTDCPSGPREILSNGEYGDLVPVANPSKLADSMARALSIPTDPERQKKAAKNFTWDKSADKYLSLC